MFNDFLPLDNVRDYIDHSGVYEIVCKKNGRSYVGQATSIIRRIMQHLSDLDNDRHSNALLQHDWNRLERGKFVFRLVEEIPYTDRPELLRSERREMNLRRNHGAQLYNDFRTVRNPETELEIAIVEEAKLRAAKHEANVAARDYRELKRQYDQGNKPHKRQPQPPDLSNYEEVSCYDCGVVGGLSLQVFKCDDDLLRCERCVDKYLGNMRGWLREKETARKVSTQWYRRYRLDSDNYEHEIMTAISRYTHRFGAKPSVIFAALPPGVSIEELSERVGIKIEWGGKKTLITPYLCIDIPLPKDSEPTRRRWTE